MDAQKKTPQADSLDLKIATTKVETKKIEPKKKELQKKKIKSKTIKKISKSIFSRVKSLASKKTK